MRPRIHFMGANGFPAKCYQPIFRLIEDKMNWSESRPGGDKPLSPSFIHPIDIYDQALTSRTWEPLRDEIIRQIERTSDQPVTAIGHSVGGALLTIAASHRPDLFHHLIVIDSPYFAWRKRLLWGIALNLLPKSVISQRNPLIKKATNKQNKWQSIQIARDYLKDRNVFRDLSPEIFESFLREGLVRVQNQSTEEGGCTNSNSEEVQLVFPRESEANLMYTVQIDIPFLTGSSGTVGQYSINKTLKGHFLYADQHDFLDKDDIALARSIFPPSFQFRSYSNTHFWPFTKPDEFADAITTILKEEVMCEKR